MGRPPLLPGIAQEGGGGPLACPHGRLGQDPLSPVFVLHLNRPGKGPSWAELLALGRGPSFSFLQNLLGDLSLKDPNSREVTPFEGCSLHSGLGDSLEILTRQAEFWILVAVAPRQPIELVRIW